MKPACGCDFAGHVLLVTDYLDNANYRYNNQLVQAYCKIKNSIFPNENFYLSVNDEELIDIANKHNVNVFLSMF